MIEMICENCKFYVPFVKSEYFLLYNLPKMQCNRILEVCKWECDDNHHSLEYFSPPSTFGCNEFVAK